ncbi:hypothetical protein ABZ876_08550 [Streptomyces sp. NPDC046931]|uniref:hypothetical protein n=1 Tax=Streptomyces sp. NPDC046931 TaxID=3154806 RepID=UPI0033C7600E
MPFPPGVQQVTVTAGASGYHAPDGTPYAGTIRFTPSVPRVVSTEHGVIALGPVNVTLGASGDFTETLLATDAADFSPSGWTYRVDEEFTNAPSRAYNISLPASAGSVDLASLTVVESSTGIEIGADAAGTAAAAVAVHNADTTDVHGITDTALLETSTGAAAKVTAHADAADPHGDRAYTLTQVSTKVTGPASSTDNAVARFDGTTGLVIQNSTVIIGDDGSVTITGNLTDAGNLVVRDSNTEATKGYRFRTSGGSLDTESGGTDWFWSTFPNPDFTGPQNNYFRMESGAAILHVTAEARFDATAFGGRGHTLDGPGSKVGFYGADPTGRPTVTGSRGGNVALASALTALATLGLIVDNTTA